MPQNDLGFNFLLVAVNRHPIWLSQVAQLVIVHEYLQKMPKFSILYLNMTIADDSMITYVSFCSYHAFLVVVF